MLFCKSSNCQWVIQRAKLANCRYEQVNFELFMFNKGEDTKTTESQRANDNYDSEYY